MSNELKPTPDEGLWLLIKRDLYECPDHSGYTGIRDNAGRYSKEEADRHAAHYGADHVVRLQDAPEFRKSAFHDLVQAHLLKQRSQRDDTISTLSAEVERLKEQVAFTLSDASRRLRKEDVIGACPHPDECFPDDGVSRCEPCAVKASAALGVVIDDRYSHLPEVCRLRREVERLTAERDAAVMQVSREAAARGQAEGRLEASEMAGVVAGWQERAEAAEARVQALTDERDRARRYCSVAASDMAGFPETLKASPEVFPRTTHDLMETSDFMALAAEGREDGTLYDDELSKEKARVRELEEALNPFADVGHLLEIETEGFADEDTCDLMMEDHLMVHFKIGDFRRARALLNREPTQ